MSRKYITSIVLSALFLISTLAGVAVIARSDTPSGTFVYGTGAGPHTIDPTNTWDSASLNVIEQCCEGLFLYDLSNTSLPMVPVLATSLGTWSTNKTQLTVPLRHNVTFQDGWAFNATAAKWNFDRLANLLGSVVTAGLYEPLNGQPVINNTVAVDTYTLQINLNYFYAPFMPLMTFNSLWMLSPNPASTPFNSVIPLTGKIVGTGPFIYDNYTAGQSVVFSAYNNYWQGAPKIQTLIFDIIKDETTKDQALLTGEIQMIDAPSPSFMSQFRSDSNIVVHQGPASTATDYLGFNEKVIDTTMRKAMSYAFNYSYYLQNIMYGLDPAMISPIPVGIPDAVTNLTVPYYNLTIARQVLVDDGIAATHHLSMANTTAQWDAIANGYTPIAAFNYTYNSDNMERAQVGALIASNFADIGIQITLIGITWDQYLDLLYSVPPDNLGIYNLGWLPDFNDPMDYINTMFTPSGGSDSGNIDNTTLDALMTAALTEQNTAVRADEYYQMQRDIVEYNFDWVMLSLGGDWGAWRAGVTGFQQNAMGYVAFYPVSYVAPTTSVPGYDIFLMIMSTLGVTALLLVYTVRKRHN